MQSRHTVLALFALFALLVAPAHGDDWLQFRHDATRSAMNRDKLVFPLKSAWNWSTIGPQGHSPLYHAVVRRQRVYFTASEKSVRYLVCADLKTGDIKWRKPLHSEHLDFAISDIAGPAITASGTVFVYDWVNIKDRATIQTLVAALYGQADSVTCGMVPEMVDCFAVRTFDATTGNEGAYFPMAAMGAAGILPRLSLTETRKGQEVAEVPPTMAGCPP